jgi:hypothetical protein
MPWKESRIVDRGGLAIAAAAESHHITTDRSSSAKSPLQLKDERQVRPEIHMLVSPLVIKFDFEE